MNPWDHVTAAVLITLAVLTLAAMAALALAAALYDRRTSDPAGPDLRDPTDLCMVVGCGQRWTRETCGWLTCADCDDELRARRPGRGTR